MKKLFPLLLLIALSPFARAQGLIDTSGGRYWLPIFPAVNVTSAVPFGAAVNVSGTNQTLYLDVYEPAGDTVQFRPLLIFVHGGSFLFGTRTDQDVATLCSRFARMGYVCASIDYRLGMTLPFDSVSGGKALLRAVQDLKAAIRYFRNDAGLSNTYRIHPGYIFSAGSSAGAFTCLHAAYLDSAEVPAYMNAASLGGLEGHSGTPGVPSDVTAVINLCGALADSSWLQAGDIPFCSMHGDLDQVVPFGSATIYVLSFPILPVDGSASLHQRAISVGVNNPFYAWLGADHVPYSGTGTAAMAYMDTTVEFVKTFLRPFFGLPVGLTGPAAGGFALYPNPASGRLTLHVPETSRLPDSAILRDAAGRTIRNFPLHGHDTVLDVEGITPGIYQLTLDLDNRTVSQKLVIR